MLNLGNSTNYLPSFDFCRHLNSDQKKQVHTWMDTLADIHISTALPPGVLGAVLTIFLATLLNSWAHTNMYGNTNQTSLHTTRASTAAPQGAYKHLPNTTPAYVQHAQVIHASYGKYGSELGPFQHVFEALGFITQPVTRGWCTRTHPFESWTWELKISSTFWL